MTKLAKTTMPPERRYVLRLSRARCGACGSVKLEVYGGHDRDGGGRLQYARCAICGTRHLLIWE